MFRIEIWQSSRI